MKDLGQHVEHLSEDTKLYIKKLIDFYKLDLFRKISKSLSTSLQLLVTGGIALLLFLFISLGLSFLIGNHLGNIAYGFFIMGGVYFILLVLASTIGKPYIDRKVLIFMGNIANNSDDDESGESNSNIQN